MKKFKLNFLDHVAIRVRDIETSARWYEKYLGLTRYQLPEWGKFPIFMLSGKSGVAIFPANLKDEEESNAIFKNIKIDHFAFNVSRDDLAKARKHFEENGIPYEFQDHHYFHSVYLKDPDGHTVELTALVVDENFFYKK